MKLSLLALLALSSATANAADLMIEVIENTAGVAAPTPTPEDKGLEPIEGYVEGATGLGARFKTGTTTNRGAFATVRFHAYVPWDSESPLVIANGGANFNVFNYEKSSKSLSTEIGGFANAFVGFSFARDEHTTDFMIGMATHLNGSGSAYSKEQSQFQGWVGPETGIHVNQEKVVATLTGSVALGGQSCTINTANGDEFEFRTNSIGFIGVGRLLVSNKVAINVLYANFPNNKNSDGDRIQGGDVVDGTLFWNIGEKLTLTGNCTINNMHTEELKTDNNGNALPPIISDLKMNNFQIGLIRRFGR